MEPFRVTVLTTSFPLGRESAAGIFVARLVDHLPERVTARVVAPAGPGDAGPTRRGRTEVRPFRYAPARWRALAQGPGGIPAALRARPWLHLLVPALLVAMAWACLRDARGSRVIHANWAVCGAVAGIAGALLRIPVVTTLRGEDVTRASRSAVDRLLLRLALALSARVVAVSEAIRDGLAAAFPNRRDRLCFVPNGVEDAFREAGERRVAPRMTGTLRCLAIGSLIPRKGFDVILEAARLAALPEARLRVVGNGPEKDALRRQAAAAALAGRVEFVPEVAPERVPALMAEADAFILASHSEGRPNVLLEAMASGLPVVASDIDGVRELVEDGVTGLLFRDGDAVGLAAALARLAGDPQLRETLGLNARRFIEESGLTWQAAGERYARLYAEAAGI